MENKKFQESKKIKTPDGVVMYVWENKLHNWDGPSLIHANGKKEYYIHGIQYTEEKYKEALRNRTGVPPMKDPRFKTRY